MPRQKKEREPYKCISIRIPHSLIDEIHTKQGEYDFSSYLRYLITEQLKREVEKP